jgi:hypothetical protein
MSMSMSMSMCGAARTSPLRRASSFPPFCNVTLSLCLAHSPCACLLLLRAQVREQCAWKYANPCSSESFAKQGGKAGPMQDYDKVVKYNYQPNEVRARAKKFKTKRNQANTKPQKRASCARTHAFTQVTPCPTLSRSRLRVHGYSSTA